MPRHVTSDIVPPRSVVPHAARLGLLVVALDARDGLRCDVSIAVEPAGRAHRRGVTVRTRFANRCAARVEASG